MAFGIAKHIHCELGLLVKRARGFDSDPLNDNLMKKSGNRKKCLINLTCKCHYSTCLARTPQQASLCLHELTLIKFDIRRGFRL